VHAHCVDDCEQDTRPEHFQLHLAKSLARPFPLLPTLCLERQIHLHNLVVLGCGTGTVVLSVFGLLGPTRNCTGARFALNLCLKRVLHWDLVVSILGIVRLVGPSIEKLIVLVPVTAARMTLCPNTGFVDAMKTFPGSLDLRIGACTVQVLLCNLMNTSAHSTHNLSTAMLTSRYRLCWFTTALL
jgi:hypothetical protein